MSFNIRPVKPEDIPWIVGQLEEFDRFVGYKKSLMSDKAHLIKGLAELTGQHLFLLAETQHDEASPLQCRCPTGKHPAGFVAGWVTKHPFNPQLTVLTEILWWVASQYRKSAAGLMLLNEFVAYGKAHCDMVTFALEKKSPVSERHLVKRGFRPQETAYVLEV